MKERGIYNDSLQDHPFETSASVFRSILRLLLCYRVIIAPFILDWTSGEEIRAYEPSYSAHGDPVDSESGVTKITILAERREI